MEKVHWAQVAHTCNPSYSGSRDQEDHSLKPALQMFIRYYVFKKSQKRTGGWAEGVGPELSTSNKTKKKLKHT
jgi:hypothetical protein